MEQDDDPQLAERLEPAEHHADLHEQGEDRAQVVAVEGRVVGVPELGADQHGEHDAAEQGGPRLFQREDDELHHHGAGAAARGAVEQAVREPVDPLLDGGEARHAPTVTGAAERSSLIGRRCIDSLQINGLCLIYD